MEPQKKAPLIDVSDKRNPWLRRLELFLQGLFTLALWTFLLHGLYEAFFGARRQQTLDMFLFLLSIALVVFLLLSGWQYYNWHLFHGKDRRKSFPVQPLEQVAKLYHMKPDDLQRLQGAGRKVDVYEKDGQYTFQVPGEEPIPFSIEQ